MCTAIQDPVDEDLVAAHKVQLLLINLLLTVHLGADPHRTLNPDPECMVSPN